MGSLSQTNVTPTCCLSVFAKVILLLPVLLYQIFTEIARNTQRHAPRRVLAHTVGRFMSDRFHFTEMQALFGNDSTIMYMIWAMISWQWPCIEEAGGGARIAWLGPKPNDPGKLIFYVPGGGFVNPIPPSNIASIHEMKEHTKQRGLNIGVAMVLYKLRPEGCFPSQLLQTERALHALLAAGYNPEDIMLCGDSAGAHIVLQLISHILHPTAVSRVDKPILPSNSTIKFRGIVLISPYVGLAGCSSLLCNGNSDVISPENYLLWGSGYLGDVPANLPAFADPLLAPMSWFDGLGTVVDKILVVAGEKECLIDAIIKFHNTHLVPHLTSDKLRLMRIQDGVHDDFVLDFAFPPYALTQSTRDILDWVADVFTQG